MKLYEITWKFKEGDCFYNDSLIFGKSKTNAVRNFIISMPENTNKIIIKSIKEVIE